jgi:hypothetical protein
MEPIIEVSTFSDGRLMLRVRFTFTSNVWFSNNEEITWVPTLKEVAVLKEALDAVNEHNEKKKAFSFEETMFEK